MKQGIKFVDPPTQAGRARWVGLMGVVGVPAGWGIFRLQNEIFSSQRDDSEQNLYRLDLPTLSLSRVISVTTLCNFFKFLATNCLTKVVQIFW